MCKTLINLGLQYLNVKISFGELLHLQPENIKKQLRDIKHQENKLVNA